MLCRKAKNTEVKGGSAQFFRHPLKISLPPPGSHPETAPVTTGILCCDFSACLPPIVLN